MPSGFFPSRLNRIKTFESIEARTRKDGGWVKYGNIDTPSIEEQINAWVALTKAFVIGTGPLMIMENDERFAGVTVVTRTLPVIFLSAVEHNDAKRPYGQPIDPIAANTESARAVAGGAQSESPAHNDKAGGDVIGSATAPGARTVLRLPPSFGRIEPVGKPKTP